MLGYIRTSQGELRVREYEVYRALYCGLCKHMGKCTGQCSRMTLSYDFVFLAALRMSLLGERPILEKKHCLMHPFHKRKMAMRSETLAYCADASALLVYHKLLDDLRDERGFKKLRALLSRPFLHAAFRRASKRHPALSAEIAERLSALSDYESTCADQPSADQPAAIFASLMEAVFAEGLEGSNARIASAVGRAIGHWIYLADAADDFFEDRKRGRFNPYLQRFGSSPTEADWENLRLAMTGLLLEAERAYLLIDTYPTDELREILSNILYLGLPEAAVRVTQNEKTIQPKGKKPT